MREITILIAERFLFIGALTIPFDIRDLFEDRQSGLKTVPVVWGEKKSISVLPGIVIWLPSAIDFLQ